MPTPKPVIISAQAAWVTTKQATATMERERDMDMSDPTFQKLQVHWQLSEALAAQATKEEIVEVARILAMQAAHYARASGELELPDLAHLLSAKTLDDESVGLLMDGTLAFVGLMATAMGIGGVDIDATMQYLRRQALNGSLAATD